MSINLRQKAITWKHHSSLIISNRFSEHLEVKTCFSYHKKQKAAQRKMPSWPQIRTKKPVQHSPHKQCLLAGARCDKAGENPYILNWVTRITAEKVWQLNNRGLKVNSCYSMLPPWRAMMDVRLSSPASLPSEGWREGKHKCLCWTVSAGLEQRRGGRMDQKPSRPSL